jgi:hypothetical protein
VHTRLHAVLIDFLSYEEETIPVVETMAELVGGDGLRGVHAERSPVTWKCPGFLLQPRQRPVSAAAN